MLIKLDSLFNDRFGFDSNKFTLYRWNLMK